MLLPSTGLTCGTFCSNDGTFTSGIRMTVPEIVGGVQPSDELRDRDDRGVLRPVRAGDEREDRARLRAVHDGDGDPGSGVDARGHLEDAERLLPARGRGRAHGKRALVAVRRDGERQDEGSHG